MHAHSRLALRLALAPTLALVTLTASCGSDAVGEALLASTLVASYDGFEFTPINGFATVSNDVAIIVVGDGPVACGSEDRSSPPRGHNAAMRVPALEVGAYGSVFTQMFSNVRGFEGIGSNTGSVTITAVTDEAVSGSVSFDYTDDEDRVFTLSGTFSVVHCAY